MTDNKRKLVLYFAALGLGIGVSSAAALDMNGPDNAENPLVSFRTGISAYKNGHTDEAVKALRYAAQMGHTGAQWKLARIYALGDGVAENDLEAYHFYMKIARNGVAAGSENESYVSDALVALGDYSRVGIAGTEIKADPARARNFYLQAAMNFGNPNAQFELGRMLLSGEGGEKNPVQAARWFHLAARKGNAAAQAMLGSMLFQAGKTVKGLAMMTAAFERAEPIDHEWIRALQERAFAIAAEADRRTAISLASDFVSRNGF